MAVCGTRLLRIPLLLQPPHARSSTIPREDGYDSLDCCHMTFLSSASVFRSFHVLCFTDTLACWFPFLSNSYTFLSQHDQYPTTRRYRQNDALERVCIDFHLPKSPFHTLPTDICCSIQTSRTPRWQITQKSYPQRHRGSTEYTQRTFRWDRHPL